MDRGRSFSILGLTENATKEQVKRAYGRKIARYKGPDYAEEPAYVERKLAQLHQAYEEAYALAESDPAAYKPSRPSRVERDVEKENRRTRKTREDDEHNAREKFHQWMERRDDDKHAKKTTRNGKKELPKLAKPDLSKLKGKLQELKEEVATQLDLHSDSSDEQEAMDFEMESLTEETVTTAYTLNDDERYTPPVTGKKKSNVGEIVKAVISLVAAVAILAGGCGDSGTDDTSYEEEPFYTYIYDQSSLEIEESDSKVALWADESYTLLTDSGEHSSSYIDDEEESDYQEKADAFAKKYWNMESLSEVTGYLYGQYGPYTVAPDAPLATQLDAIFAFYGFASLDTASWYDQPYTGERMQGYGDYLDYLNQFYDAQ